MAEYIKRADAMQICQGYSQHCFETNDSKGQDIADRIEDDIVEIPTADVVEVKHGEWEKPQFIGRSGFREVRDFICSICGKEYAVEQPCNLMNYCPYCGAKMDGGKQDNAYKRY